MSRTRLVSFKSAAEVLNVHPRTVRRLVARGQLTGYRVSPRIIRVSLDDVESLLKPIPTAGDAA